MAERPEEMDDEELLKLLMSRMTAPPARMAVEVAQRMSTPKGTGPKITRSDLTPEINQELREDWKTRGRTNPKGDQYFDQSPESKDFKRVKEFIRKAPGRVKKIDFTEAPETHESRRLQRQMRAETKGAQHEFEQNLRDYLRAVEEGYVKGGGKFGVKTTVKKLGAKALFRGVPVLGAGYAGFRLGTSLSPAAKRNRGRDARREVYEQRQERMRDVFPGRTDDFYRQMAQHMGKEDEEGREVQDAEEVLRIFELQKEIESIKDGPARELVKQERRGR